MHIMLSATRILLLVVSYTHLIKHIMLSAICSLLLVVSYTHLIKHIMLSAIRSLLLVVSYTHLIKHIMLSAIRSLLLTMCFYNKDPNPQEVSLGGHEVTYWCKNLVPFTNSAWFLCSPPGSISNRPRQ